jgi:tRNA-dihydrouridine synthase 1
MMNSKIMIQDKGYLKANFEIDAADRPLFVQLCGNDPQTVLKAAQMVENDCEAVDLNLGCPQGIAKKGHYGSFLLKEPELICQMVSILYDNLKIPVTCKMRILSNEEETIDLCKRIEEAGCSILTIHGRTKEQNKDYVGEANWDIIKKIRTIIKIPIFCNGGIYNYADVEKCLEYTKVQGIMSSEALLENPCLFANKIYDLDLIALEYLDMCLKYKSDIKYIKPHLFKFLHSGLSCNHDLRERLAKGNSFEEFLEITTILQKRRENIKPDDKFGWYWRYQNKVKKEENKEKKQEIKNEKMENNGKIEEESKAQNEDPEEIKDILIKKRKKDENDKTQYMIFKK